MKRVLVVFASSTGCTRGIAGEIAEALHSAGAQVDLRAVGERPDPRRPRPRREPAIDVEERLT